MLDGICAGISRGLYADGVGCVDGNPEVLTVRFINHRRKLTDCDILFNRDLDYIDILERILANCLPRPVCPSVEQQKFLLEDVVGQGGIEVVNVS